MLTQHQRRRATQLHGCVVSNYVLDAPPCRGKYDRKRGCARAGNQKGGLPLDVVCGLMAVEGLLTERISISCVGVAGRQLAVRHCIIFLCTWATLQHLS